MQYALKRGIKEGEIFDNIIYRLVVEEETIRWGGLKG